MYCISLNSASLKCSLEIISIYLSITLHNALVNKVINNTWNEKSSLTIKGKEIAWRMRFSLRT